MRIQNAVDRVSQYPINLSFIEKLKRFRDSPLCFQKICQVASAILQLALLRYPPAAPSLAKLNFALQTANMHNLYNFLRWPRQWFAPITAEKINRHQLAKILATELDSYKKEKDYLTSLKNAQFFLQVQLEEMATHQDAYCNVEQLLEVLERRLQVTQIPGYDFSCLRLNSSLLTHPATLKAITRPTPLIKIATNSIGTMIDFSVIALYLRNWTLLDTAKWAQHIGSYPALGWVMHYHLERWVVGLITGAFVLRVIESTRRLGFEALNQEQKNAERWHVVTLLAEAALWGATYLSLKGRIHIPSSYLYLFAIFTKSLGLFTVTMKSR